MRNPTAWPYHHSIYKEVNVAPPGQKPLFDAWVESQRCAPTGCQYHPGVPVILTGCSCQGWADDMYSRRRLGPGEDWRHMFVFTASYHCPGCRSARAGCPQEFHSTQLDTFDISTDERRMALQTCRAFIEQVETRRAGFALLVGMPGTGKTRLACDMLKELAELEARYIRHGTLTTQHRASYGRKEIVLGRQAQDNDSVAEDKPRGVLDLLQKVPLLVLDELGCTAMANDERLLMDELLKERYDCRRPTILISNLDLRQLREFLGDALTERIAHATGNHRFVLQFNGSSYRRGLGVDYLEGLPLKRPSPSVHAP